VARSGGCNQLNGDRSSIVDSIVGSVVSKTPLASLEYCDLVSGKYVVDGAPGKTGKNCLHVDPGFVNRNGPYYELSKKSPCRKQASDGGDLGVRFTPQMEEIIHKALELRAAKLITF
jgi:hypothetical protein